MGVLPVEVFAHLYLGFWFFKPQSEFARNTEDTQFSTLFPPVISPLL